jgi:hypothetical protein
LISGISSIIGKALVAGSGPCFQSCVNRTLDGVSAQRMLFVVV